MHKLNSRALYWVLAFSIAGVLLYFSLRGVDWRQVGSILSHANILYLFLALGISSFALFCRAVRWRILLRAGAPVTVPAAFWATSAGYFGNNFLPARAGELVRTFIISARTGLSKTFVLTTALAERLSDAVALVIISSIVLLTLSHRPGWFQHAAKPFAILGLCGAACIAVLPRMEHTWKTLLERLPLPHGLAEKFGAILAQVLVGLRTFHDAGRIARFAGLTIVIWCSDAAGTMIIARSLGLSISLPVAFLLITGLGLGSALPATPGYVGIYQFVAVSVLTPFGFAKSDAIAYSFLSQAMQYVFVSFYGLLAFSRQRGLSLKKISQQSAT
jgi:glycosyltransferase 2 family protein